MPTDVTSTLRQTLSQLAAERQRIDRQTAPSKKPFVH